MQKPNAPRSVSSQTSGLSTQDSGGRKVLRLHRETLRTLSGPELQMAAGGSGGTCQYNTANGCVRTAECTTEQTTH